MTRLAKKAASASAYREFISDPVNIADILSDSLPPPQVFTWLSRLGRLHGVPFNYLVPNEKMLPNESIRFFQVDFNWLTALIEGACSIGHLNEAFRELKNALNAKLQDAVALRSRVAETEVKEHVTGFFLRSQLVSGWPKLEVVAYDEADVELDNVIRMERLSESVLLYAVEGKLDHILIREPAVGLHFGVDISGDKFLRYVTVPGDAPADTRPGDQMDVKPANPEYRNSGKRTLKVNKLALDMAKTLHENNADNSPDGDPLPFTSAEFALEMVEGMQEVEFRFKAPAEKKSK